MIKTDALVFMEIDKESNNINNNNSNNNISNINNSNNNNNGVSLFFWSGDNCTFLER